MEFSILNIAFVLVYFIVVVGIGLWTKQKETVDEYLNAGRSVGLWQTVASIVAVIGGIVLVGQAAVSYDIGFGSMWLWIGIALGMIGLGFSVNKIKKLADKNNFLTLSDYIFVKFGTRNAQLSAIILFLTFFALLTGQFIAGAALFAPLFNIPGWVAIIILGGVTLTYLLLGGFKAVIKTDFLQFLVMAGILLLVLFNIDSGGISAQQFDLFGSVDVLTLVSLLAIGLFTIFAAPDIWQRLFSAKSASVARNASFISAGMFVLLGLAITILGLAAKANFPGIIADEALFYGMFQMVPTAFLGLSVVFVLAAIMSTIDTELFYLSSSIAKDFSRKSQVDNEGLKKIIAPALVGLTVVSVFVAIFLSNIVLFLFSLLSLTLCVAPVVVSSLVWKLKKHAVTLSMGGALLAFVITFALGNLTPDTAVITLPVAVILLIIGQIVFPKEVQSAEQEI